VLGNRIEEDVTAGMTTTVTRFAYDGSNAWADLDASNFVTTRRLYLDAIDAIVARVATTGGVAAWYLTDRLGSVRDITDATGAVQDRITYDGYGNVLSETNASFGDRYKFTSREFDSATGLQYNRARYYDPTIGRWTSQDPLGFDGETRISIDTCRIVRQLREIPRASFPLLPALNLPCRKCQFHPALRTRNFCGLQ
jgi:RHS repeat-associated protein